MKKPFDYCIYWKGEEECPAKFFGSAAHEFWRLERSYWNSLTDDARASYEKIADAEYPRAFPSLVPVLDRLPHKESRGAFAYVVDYFFYMQPHTDLKIFLDYGKK